MIALKIIIKIGIMTLLISGCGAKNEQHQHASDAAHAAPAAADVASDFSLYDLAHEWTDQHGARRTLASLAGRPQVIAMVYTSCAVACPRIVADMKRLEGELGERAGAVGFVMVSIDPTRDTPQRLHEYAAATHLDPQRWTLLTAPDDVLLDLAVLLGVRYRRISDTVMEHSNVITIVDAAGRIVHRQVGLGTDPSESLRVLTQQLR
jgi:protein SCO1/2